MSLNEAENQPFWDVTEPYNIVEKWLRYLEKDRNIGILNSARVEKEMHDQYVKSKEKGWWRFGIWYRYFDHTPQLRVPGVLGTDYLSSQGYEFVSPKLFALLDQPRGTLQGLKTDTTWLGSSTPDWSYLWLSYIPIASAIDTDLVHPESLRTDTYGTTGAKGVILDFPHFTPLREDIDTPFGLFRAAESPAMLLASDAVAVSVLRAGCTGINFDEVETTCVLGGPVRRRGANGVEERSDVVLYRHGFPLEGTPDEAARRAREEAMAAHKDPAAMAHLRR